MSMSRIEGGAASPVWKKAMVTAAAMAGLWAGQFITLPMVDYDSPVQGGVRVRWSIMVLGMYPLLQAFVLVELAALLVPPWRRLREGGPTTRGRLRRAALILGLVLAAGQALTLALWGEQSGVVTSNPGWSFRLLIMVTLLGATAVLIVLAQFVDRYGLGNGFSVLILASFFPGTIRALGDFSAAVRSGTVAFNSGLAGACVVVGVVAATLWMFSPYRLPHYGLSGNKSPLRLPACGIVPLFMVPALLLYVGRLTGPELGSPWQSVGRALQPESSSYLVVLLVFSVGAAALFSWLFNRPSRVNHIWQRFPEAATLTIAQLKAAMFESVIFIVLLVVGQRWLIGLWGDATVPRVLTIAVATGIVLDLVREVRAQHIRHNLVAIWEMHQVYAVDPALRLLASEGIPVFPRGLQHRTLLQFFGPFVPVHLFVEKKDAQRAHALLQSRLPA